MIPVITILFIIFLIVFKYRIAKSDADQSEVDRKFWEREQKANSTLRKDISNLNYITIPEELFPLNIKSETQKKLKNLSQEKILNLTGYTNTDIKLEFGISNFEHITQCDDNFTEMVKLIPIYANELCQQGHNDTAKAALEFAVDNHCDSKAIYTQLAQLYYEAGEDALISKLIDNAKDLNSLSKDPIIASLCEIQFGIQA